MRKRLQEQMNKNKNITRLNELFESEIKIPTKAKEKVRISSVPLGKKIKLEEIPDTVCLIVVSGKIRVIKNNPEREKSPSLENKKNTVLVFGERAVIAPELLREIKNSNVSLVSSSLDTEICSIPNLFAQENSTLREQASQSNLLFLKAINHILSDEFERINLIQEDLEQEEKNPSYQKSKNLLTKKSLFKGSSHLVPYTLGWYISLLKDNWMIGTQMFVSSLLVQIFALGIPFFHLVIFEKVFGYQNTSALVVITIGMLLISVFDLIIKNVRSYVLSYQSGLLSSEGSQSLIEKIFSIPVGKLNKDYIKDCNYSFSQIPKIDQSILAGIFTCSLEVLTSLIVLFLMFALCWQMALVSLVSVLTLSLIIFIQARQNKDQQSHFSQSWQKSQIKISESLAGMETLKAANANSYFSQGALERSKESLKESFFHRFLQFNQGNFFSWISTVSSLSSLFVGAQQVLKGGELGITFGVYMAVNMMNRIVVSAFQKFSTWLSGLQEIRQSMGKLKQLYQEIGEEKYNTSSQGLILKKVFGRIEFFDIGFKYSQESNLILEDLNLSIEPGQKVIICGKSGAGKTTITRLLQKIYLPQAGHIELDGYNLIDINLSSLRERVAVSLQKPFIFTGTVRENLTLHSEKITTERILEASRISQLDKMILNFPEGFDTRLLSMGANLSGGQSALVCLTRTLASEPEILIIDEVIDAIDASAKEVVFKQILQRYESQTCIFVTNYLPMHRIADKILVLDKGRIVEEGTWQELNKAGRISLYQALQPEETDLRTALREN